MALKERIDYDTLCFLEVCEDEIALGEWLRNTSNGEVNRELWPKGEPFKYRSYQKEWLTDKSPYISVVAGRAVGKCQSLSARVYTDRGYKTISELIKLPSFTTYALDANGKIVLRRAKAYFDKYDTLYELETESGKVIQTTKNHPYLTLEGWKKLKDMRVGEYVGVATRLPELHNAHAMQWHELRWFGYIALSENPGAETFQKMRFRKQVAEMRLIAKKFGAVCQVEDRSVRFKRKPGQAFLRNNASWLLLELGHSNLSANRLRRFYPQITELPNAALQVFLEALFSQYAHLDLTEVSITYPFRTALEQLQEMLLRFGIESRLDAVGDEYKLSLYDSRAIYRFYTTFKLPGVSVGTIPLPPPSNDTSEHLRFERVTRIQKLNRSYKVYAIYVYQDHNYISEDVYVHNSLVLEDKIVYEYVNPDIAYPVTKESLLATANQAQLNPILDRIITRFTTGKFLQSFLNNNVNKSQGVLKFPTSNAIFTARIAAGKGESNLVGLHVPKMKIDEAQLFSMPAYTQVLPALNSWEPGVQIMITGVPNGLTNTALYAADQKFAKYKKYRIPSHNNPYYSRADDIENIKRYGGETADEYLQLVLGRHGSPATQVLSQDSIKQESFDFYSYRFTQNNKVKGETYEYVLERPKLPEGLTECIAVIDPGFIDPTVIHVIGKDKKGVSRVYLRYKFQRIQFPEQETIIDWLDDRYGFTYIGIDIGAGGNGASLLQGLQSREQYKHKRYDKRILGFNNSEAIVIGRDDERGTDIKKDSKAIGTEELVRRIEQGDLVFSEFDAEGVNELSRISKQKGMNGVDRYFIMSQSGKGKDSSDHIYASLLIWGLMVRETGGKRKKKLGRSSAL